MNKAAVPQQAKTAVFLPSAQGMLQRKCACGSHTVGGGECETCAKKKGDLQRKLTIGASNDPLEREADRVADEVLAVPVHSPVSAAPPRIQRFSGQATEGANTAPGSVDRVIAGSGRPLEPALRQDMEQRFGYDFSRVRVHSDGAAEQSARDVNANAFTVGHNIVFGAGRFEPASYEGRRLIAHELTHVVQQSGGGGAPQVEQSNKYHGPSPISAHVFQPKSSSVGLAVQRDEATTDKATDPFEESRKLVAEIRKNWEEVKSAASSFKGTEEWITRGNTVVYLIDQHTTAAINASKAGRSQLFKLYLKLLESDKVMYDYIAWHVVVHANILGMKLSSLAASFKADNREFTGRKEAEEHLQLLQKLADVFSKQSDAELKQVIVSNKFTAKSGDVILAETTATSAFSDQSFFEKQTTELIDLQTAIQTLTGELNKFLDNAQKEGLKQVGQALIEFIQARGGGKGKGPKMNKPKPTAKAGDTPAKTPTQKKTEPAQKKEPPPKKDQPEKKAQEKKPEEKKLEEKKKADEQKKEEKKTCATQFSTAINCSKLPFTFTFPNPQAALLALKASTGSKNLRLVTAAPSTGGPCPGIGTHHGVKDGGTYIASISCCPCCMDTPAGPIMMTRCRII